MTTELCENCGKPKEEHPVNESDFDYGCEGLMCYEFTPKKSNDSHSSQRDGSKTNDIVISDSMTLKSSGSDTLLQIEQRIRKGCGEGLDGFHYCGEEMGINDKRFLCDKCKGLLEGFQKGKLEQKKEDKNKQDEFYNEFDLASNCSKDDKLFKKLWNKYFKQLQKEIGEEKGK